uniref:Starch-binding domain-containing protein 1 n=1 Tax=Amphiprion percula TaxID=161767 RepID=A0A3P8S2S5_AMPPE
MLILILSAWMCRLLKKKFKVNGRNRYSCGVVLKKLFDKVMSSSYKDQHSDPMDNKESLGKMGDQPVLSTETSHPDIPSFFQDKQSDQNIADLPEVTAGAAPVINKPPICQVQLPSFEQSELTLSSSGFGGENAVIPLPVNEQTNTVSLLDESLENSKKVVAVQPMPQNVNVIFRIHYHTHSPYQKVAVTGNQQELGNWKEFIPLERAEDGQWSSVVSLPAESHVEWKFVVVDKGDVCRWEECGNRLLDTGSGDDLLVHRWWGIL